MIQDIKQNINKIDYELKNLFENVSIDERTNGNEFYFEINAESKFFNLNESKDWKKAKVKIKISKKDISSNNIKWSYLSNPLNESSDVIERVSSLDNISKDIHDLITKSKMDKNYLSGLESINESINENSSVIADTSISTLIKGIVSKYVKVNDIQSSDKIILENNIFMTSKPDKTYKIYHEGDIKLSDKFKIESEINANSGVNYTLFKEGVIEVNYSNK